MMNTIKQNSVQNRSPSAALAQLDVRAPQGASAQAPQVHAGQDALVRPTSRAGAQPTPSLRPGDAFLGTGSSSESPDTAPASGHALKGISRQDSLTHLLREKTGQGAMAERLLGDQSPVPSLQASWLSVEPDILAANNALYLRSGLVLGQGSSGVVSLGVAVGTGELVAIKRTPYTHGHATSARRTARALANMGSTMAPHQILKTGNAAYFIEALKTLDMFGVAHTSLDTRTRHGLAWLVLEGVAPQLLHLHANRQAHCDIKPANIMQRSSQVHLIDYDFVKDMDRSDYRTTHWYAPPETLGMQHKSGLENLDCWCLGASLWEVATGQTARSILSASTEKFDGLDWRLFYTGIYPYLRTNKKPVLNYLEKRMWAAFEELQPFMRSVILGLMHPAPSLRLRLEAAQSFLSGPEALAECDLDAARSYLRQRAQGRAQEFVPAVEESKKQLQEHSALIEKQLGSLPAWLAPKA